MGNDVIKKEHLPRTVEASVKEIQDDRDAFLNMVRFVLEADNRKHKLYDIQKFLGEQMLDYLAEKEITAEDEGSSISELSKYS